MSSWCLINISVLTLQTQGDNFLQTEIFILRTWKTLQMTPYNMDFREFICKM